MDWVTRMMQLSAIGRLCLRKEAGARQSDVALLAGLLSEGTLQTTAPPYTGGTMLKDELRAKVADLLYTEGYTYSALCVREHRPADSLASVRAVAAAEAVIALLDDYDEVRVDECRNSIGGHWLRMPDCATGHGGLSGRIARRTIYMVKEKPQTVTVPREDAALLMEFVKDAPRHSPELDAAAGRVKKAIG